MQSALREVRRGCLVLHFLLPTSYFLASNSHSYLLTAASCPLSAVYLHILPPHPRQVRDYFVYKDAYAPYAYQRKTLQGTGRRGQDAFLLLVLALEARARRIGKLVEPRERWLERNRALMEADRRGEAPSTFLRAVLDT